MHYYTYMKSIALESYVAPIHKYRQNDTLNILGLFFLQIMMPQQRAARTVYWQDVLRLGKDKFIDK